MKLIDFDGIEFKVADEALLVRPIRELFRQDKSKKKDEFWKNMSFVWNMYDPRSNYQYILDENERSDEIKKQEGLGTDWKPSSLLEDVASVYKKQSITSASLLLEDMRHGVETLRSILRQFSSISISDPREASTVAKALTDTIQKIPDLAKALVEAEKALAKDFDSEDAARGNAEKSMFEDE